MLLKRVWTTLMRRRHDRDLDDEIRAHIDLLAAEYERRGMSHTAARFAARRAFGGVEPMKEIYRDRHTLRWIEDLRRDVRYALRGLGRSPGFAVVAVLTLALGIGANTAIFSLLESVLFRSLPVEQPQQLVFLRTAGAGNLGNAPPYPAFERFRHQASSFAGIAAFATDELRVEVDGIPEQVFGQVVSGSYFNVLGVKPAAGRLMTADDEALDPPVAIIGYRYAQRRFGGPATALGRQLSFRNRTFTIVGVTPARFVGLEPGRHVDVTLPITQERALLANPLVQWFNIVARMRPAVTMPRADVEVNAIFQSFLADHGRSTERLRSRVDRVALTPASRGLDQLRSRFSSPLVALTLVAGMLSLVACANLAGLLLVRGAARGREFAIRLATGAGSARLIRQVLTETLVLFVAGAAAGLLVASLIVQRLTSFFAVGRRPLLLDVQYDWWIVAYATAMTLGAAWLTGLWPALRVMRTDPQTLLRSGTARPSRSRGAVTGRTLVTGQVAVSLALIVAAALFVRTVANLRRVDLGFRPAGVLTMSLAPDVRQNATPAARETVWRRVLERVSGLSGVRAVSLSVLTPLSGRNTGAMVTAPGSRPREIRLNHISEGYFRAFETQVLAGRSFESTDVAGAAKVAVLNETAAKAAFPERSPLGERMVIGSAGEYQVVGVVRDHKHLSLREDASPSVFVPVWQPIDALGRLTLSVASDVNHATLTRVVADAVRGVDSSMLIADVIGVDDQIDATLVTERALSTLATAGAAIVLGLAVVGLYGIVSYSVASRRMEFGIRLALGARRARVASGVVGEVLAHVAAGIVVGMPLAIGIARGAEGLLFGVNSADSTSYAAGAAALVLAAGVAAWLPAARAARIDPAISLRSE